MINDASSSFKCHYGASFSGAITSSAANLYSVRDAGVKEEKIQSLFPSALKETGWK